MTSAGTTRRTSLVNRVLISNIGLVGISLFFLTALFLITQGSVLQGQLESRATLLAEFLANQSELAMLVRNRAELERTAAAALSSEDVLYVVMTDLSGEVLAQATHREFPLSELPKRRPTEASLMVTCKSKQLPPGFLDVARFVTTRTGSEVLDWESPKAGDSRVGVVRVGFSMAKQRALFTHAVVYGVLVAFVTLLLILVVQYLQLTRLLGPLRHLVNFADKVGAGDLKQRAPMESLDEVADLTVAFNHMVEELDVSRQDLLQMVDAAQEASRLKSDFLATISHELRTPMNGILGMNDLILVSDLTPEQEDYAMTVRESALRLMTIINDVLDISSIESGRITLESAPFAFEDAVSQVLKTLAFRAHERDLELACRLDPKIPATLIGDSHRLRQILLNLIGNALKFTPQGEVLVSAEMESESEEGLILHFVVSDTGIGIAPERQKAIFDPFTQVEASNTRKYGGTGLGLSISARLVELMQGRIWLESHEGEGSRFHFTARLGRAPGALNLPAQPDAAQLAGMRVLVVDDNATSRQAAAAMCETWGLAVNAAESGAAGLEMIRQANTTEVPYHFVLVDAQMPEMDGFEVARQLQLSTDITGGMIMMLNACAVPEHAKQCNELGVFRHLVKPVMPSDLMGAMLAAFVVAT